MISLNEIDFNDLLREFEIKRSPAITAILDFFIIIRAYRISKTAQPTGDILATV